MKNIATKLLRGAFYLVSGIVVLSMLTICGFRQASLYRETKAAGELAPESGRWISTDLGAVFISEAGPAAGPLVIFTHGTAAWSGLWRPTLDALGAKGFRAVALDLPPFGFSDRMGVKSVTRADQANRIRGVITGLGVQRAIIVGHSFGSGPAVETAMRYPESVSALVLIDAALGLPPDGIQAQDAPPWLLNLLNLTSVRNGIVATTLTNPLLTKSLFSALVHRKDTITDEHVAILQRPMAIRHSTEHFGKWLLYFVQPDRSALSSQPQSYRALNLPVSIIWGDKDNITPVEQGVRLRQLIPNSSLTLLNGVGHIPSIEDPLLFQGALFSAIERHAK